MMFGGLGKFLQEKENNYYRGRINFSMGDFFNGRVEIPIPGIVINFSWTYNKLTEKGKHNGSDTSLQTKKNLTTLYNRIILFLK